MNKQTDRDPLPELAALRQRLSNLEAEHRELKRQATGARRPAFSRKFLLCALPMAFVLATAGLLYAVDALFIDKSGNVGIGTTSPAEKLEIAGTKEQGARTIVSDGGGQNRRVILMEAPGKNNFGRIAAYQYGATAGGKDLILQDMGGNVGIGTASPSPGAKLDVKGKLNVSDTASLKDTTINGGLTVNGTGNSSFAGKVGIGTANPPRETLEVGGSVYISGRDNYLRFDQKAEGDDGTIGNSLFDPGLDIVGINNDETFRKIQMYGEITQQQNSGTNTWDGINYFSGNVGIGTASPKAKLHLQGPSVAIILQDGNNSWSMYNESGTSSLIFQKGEGGKYSGFRSDGQLVAPSDARLKKEVRELPDVLARALKLRPVSYKLKSETNSATRLGFIAQEVEPLFPEVVSEMAGFKGIAYADMVPIAIGAIKELDQIVRESQAALDESTTKVEHLERKVAGQDELLLWPRYLDNGTYDLPLWKSDARFKTDVCTISAALDKVNRLNGITYRWNRTALDYFTADIERTISAGPDATPEANQKVWQAERARRYKELSNTNAGVVAQDVEAVLPEAVSTDESGYKSVNYYELIPLLIEALKEEDGISKGQSETIARQQAEIQRLTATSQFAVRQLNELREVKQKLARLEAAMSTLAASGSSGGHNDLISSAEGSKPNPGNTLDSH